MTSAAGDTESQRPSITDDLAAFLLARIAEDEQRARAVQDNSAPWGGQWEAHGDYGVRTYNGWAVVYGHGDTPLRPGVAAYIAHWDPDRVLAECEAKRRTVEWCVEVIGDRDLTSYGRFGCLRDERWALAVTLAMETMQLLSAPHADHPDYRPEWRP